MVGLLFMGCASISTAPTQEARQALAPNGKLRVGLQLGSPHNVIRDSASGEMKGVGYDLGRELARRLGVPFEPITYPSVGALLDAKAVHTGRSAYQHLHAMAATHGIPTRRVDEVIEMTGLAGVAGKRVGGFSLGMGQRLGIAVALLGDPRVVVLDEPVNGLDPEGILWIRQFMQGLAAEGRTVLVSSHLLSEMALTAQDLVVIGRGKLISQSSTTEFVERSTENTVRVRSPHADKLGAMLIDKGFTVREDADGSLTVSGALSDEIGDIAASGGVVLHELSPQRGSLEQAFMQLTGDSVEYHAELAETGK